jgi:ribosomal protein L3
LADYEHGEGKSQENEGRRVSFRCGKRGSVYAEAVGFGKEGFMGRWWFRNREETHHAGEFIRK